MLVLHGHHAVGSKGGAGWAVRAAERARHSSQRSLPSARPPPRNCMACIAHPGIAEVRSPKVPPITTRGGPAPRGTDAAATVP